MSRGFAVVGLGKLGAAVAAAIASRGHRVIGADIDGARVDAINAGRSPVREPGLQDVIAGHRARLSATTDIGAAVQASELTFLIVPTPSDASGRFDLSAPAAALAAIGRALASTRDRHTVALTCTVAPGATRTDLLPVLARELGSDLGHRVGFCYSPVLVALGSVVRDFLHPDLILIGELNRASGDHLEAGYRDIVGAGAPTRRMTFENAEIAKLSINAYVTMKISFANMLAGLCSAVPGADVDVVSDALGHDARIGRKYLTGGLGFGGPCFPRDNAALAAVAAAAGVDPALPLATDAVNRQMVGRVLDLTRSTLRPGAVVAVLGLAYKPGSEVVEASQALEIARALRDSGAAIRVFDPLVADPETHLGRGVTVAPSARDCVRGAGVVMVATPDPAFADLTPADFATPVTVLDFWRLLSRSLSDAPGIDYRAYGRARA